MADLRTPEQKEMMAKLFPLLLSGIQKGATPFGGMLSQPPDPSMLSAMNVMHQMGGQGPYTFPGMQTGPYLPSGGINPPPVGYNGDGGGSGGGYSPGSGRERPWEPQDYDPYAPWRPGGRRPGPKPR